MIKQCFKPLLCLGFMSLLFPALAANPLPVDPLNSPSWGTMAKQLLGNDPIVFDDRVNVLAPASAEDSMNVPVSVSVKGLDHIEQILVFSDLNPIPKILVFRPIKSDAYLAFRFKVQQSTPIRAAVQTTDKVWHVGGRWIDAAGGGCTSPSVGMTSGNWTNTLGQVSAKRWLDPSTHSERVRMKIMHPMDTGLAPGIPAFHITNLDLLDQKTQPIAQLELFEPVSENPVLSFDIHRPQASNSPILISGRDNNGNRFHAEILE